jgi:hypothetical protein
LEAAGVSKGQIDPANLTLRIPRELVSPNQWNGRHWRVKHRISQDWEHALGTALLDEFSRGKYPGLMNALGVYVGPKKWIGYEAGKVRVSITREVPSGRNFIRDDDNLRFCVKPLLDALKRQGYIKNDSRKWIELPTPEQRISADGEYWTEIQIAACDEAQDVAKSARAVLPSKQKRSTTDVQIQKAEGR